MPKTTLTLDEARPLVAAFGLALESLEALPAQGTINSNFRARASGRVWFLRINESKRDDDVAAEARLVERLAAAGLATPAPLRAGARAFLPWAGKQVSLFPWLPFREAAPRADQPDGMRAAGAALGDLHRLSAGFDERPANHYTLDELERRLGTFAADARFADVVPALAGELERARRRPPVDEGLIHQDLFPDNVLVDSSGALAAVLDFEQATWGGRLYDVAVALNAWCWDGTAIAAASADALLDAYGRHRAPLDVAARARLAADAALAAARFTITRITDVFLPDGVDEDLRRRKDWRDFARRLAWWRAAGS